MSFWWKPRAANSREPLGFRDKVQTPGEGNTKSAAVQICVGNLLELGHHQLSLYVEFLEKPIWSWHPSDLLFMLLPQQLILKWKIFEQAGSIDSPTKSQGTKADAWGGSGRHLAVYLPKGVSALFSVCALSFDRISISTPIFLYLQVLCGSVTAISFHLACFAV